MRITEFIERSNAAASTEELTASFRQAIQDVGYEGYVT